MAPTVSGGTEEGVILGTVGYMSPEQAAGLAIDYRSDQFAFGSILYEMATGRRAFQRASAPQTLTAIIQDEPEPIAAINPRVPAPLRWIVERCLARSRADASRRQTTSREISPRFATGSPRPRARLKSQTGWLRSSENAASFSRLVSPLGFSRPCSASLCGAPFTSTMTENPHRRCSIHSVYGLGRFRGRGGHVA